MIARLRLALFVAALLPGVASAAQFAPVFSDRAVLQRDRPIAVWGTGRDGEKVTVELLDRSASAVVSGGRWQVELPALPATDRAILRLRGDHVVELADVAIGEVWLGLGQSNMEWRLNQCAPFTDALLATADDPGIRELKVPLRTSVDDPLPAFTWKTFDRPSAGKFGAVGYYFAAELRRRLGVVVGIVNCSYGGTPLEAWMSRAAIDAAGERAFLAEHDAKLAAWPTRAAYEEARAAALAERKAWDERQKAGVPAAELGPRPVEPYGPRFRDRAFAMREAMLAVVTPYSARGALWYQGESNAGRSTHYESLLRAFITEIRRDWNAPTLPFFIAQLASPNTTAMDDGEQWAVLREAQRRVATSELHSGFVVALDHAEHGNVHPRQKQPIGERFARLALVRTYGLTGFAAQSPFAATGRLEDGAVTVTFADLPGQLVVRDPALPTLEVQLADGSWRAAAGTLASDGKSLRVSLSGAPGGPPRAVRYAWRNYGPLSLFTDENLPVSPWHLTVTP
jgi:sialate O-acetylesterase